MRAQGGALAVVTVFAAGCADTAGDAPVEPAPARPAEEYLGVETRLLDDDLVTFRVAMAGKAPAAALRAYTDCAAARYALIRGYGFARHVRTNLDREGGTTTADAVYTISPALPRGVDPLDAATVAGACDDRGIPTV
ncbi:MAG: hypothetical protein ACLFRZ_08560 [Rhodosalinus sp.]